MGSGIVIEIRREKSLLKLAVCGAQFSLKRSIQKLEERRSPTAAMHLWKCRIASAEKAGTKSQASADYTGLTLPDSLNEFDFGFRKATSPNQILLDSELGNFAFLGEFSRVR